MSKQEERDVQKIGSLAQKLYGAEQSNDALRREKGE